MERLKVGSIYSNNEIREIFGCSTQGGMRRSHSTKTLVLVSNQTQETERNPYQDRWENNILHYTGMGLKGDQDINFAQNKTLSESNILDITVHLFEVYNSREYTYKGVIELAGSPYESEQIDNSENKRTVWMFPLKTK